VRGFFGFIFVLFLIWAGWASFSTGGLYELKQFNPDYAHPNRNTAYLISKINFHESNGYWDNYHVEQCSFQMPDWAKAKKCVEARIACDRKSPKVDNSFGSKKIKRDIFSDAFKSCWGNTRPSLGPMAWLRGSRASWRLGIVGGVAWLAGGFDADSREFDEWVAKNKGWTESIEAWLQEGN